MGARGPAATAPCGTPAALRRHLRHGEKPSSTPTSCPAPRPAVTCATGRTPSARATGARDGRPGTGRDRAVRDPGRPPASPASRREALRALRPRRPGALGRPGRARQRHPHHRQPPRPQQPARVHPLHPPGPQPVHAPAGHRRRAAARDQETLMTLTLAGWIAIVLAPAILLAAAICATPYAIQAWRPCSQPIPQGELEALIDATREHPAGPCGCAPRAPPRGPPPPPTGTASDLPPLSRPPW